MQDYTANSKRSREQPQTDGKPADKVIEKVTLTEVVVRKKPLGRRFREIFVFGDVKTAASYVAADILWPALRNLAFEMLQEGGRKVIFPDGTRRGPASYPYGPRTTYNSPVDRGYRPQSSRSSVIPAQVTRSQSRRDGFEIILGSRAEAEVVLERLTDIIDQYEVASVADLHELIGISSSHTDNKWGWTVLNNVQIRQIREGFLLDLPAAENI